MLIGSTQTNTVFVKEPGLICKMTLSAEHLVSCFLIVSHTVQYLVNTSSVFHQLSFSYIQFHSVIFSIVMDRLVILFIYQHQSG